jgi:excisionase family DNA binding protein
MNNTLNIPKMMTVREIAKTGLLPENTIRVMLRNGQIQAVYSGRKALINFDNLCEYLRTLTVTA